jgi:transcriptional regulator with XRE-family HTH domain
MVVGDNIRKIRLEKGLTEAQLAALAGITQGAVSHLELGTREDPRLSTVAAIAAALRVSVKELLTEKKGEKTDGE